MHRMTFLFRLWLAAGDEGVLGYTPGVVAGYWPPAELEAFGREAVGEVNERAEGILASLPAT